MGKIVYHKGSLFDAPPNSILVHAGNCRGMWNSGIAKEFKERFPDAFADYNHFCEWSLPNPGTYIIYPNSDFGGYDIMTLLTSHDSNEDVDSTDKILEATEKALTLWSSHRKFRYSEAEHLRYAIPIDHVYSNKFNSGGFKVPWEKTAEVIERIWPYEWNVYTGAGT